jgi:hypothetical protein
MVKIAAIGGLSPPFAAQSAFPDFQSKPIHHSPPIGPQSLLFRGAGGFSSLWRRGAGRHDGSWKNSVEFAAAPA